MEARVNYQAHGLRPIRMAEVLDPNACFFPGFVEGFLAGDRLTVPAGRPARALAPGTAFARRVGDEHAENLLARVADADLDGEATALLGRIAKDRRSRLDPACPRSAANWVLGFCEGLRHSGPVTAQGMRLLHGQLRGGHDLSGDPRIAALLHSLDDALEEAGIDPERSEEIGALISALVDDDFAKTGMPGPESLPVFEDQGPVDADGLPGRTVVLTGAFRRGPQSEIAALMRDHGVRVARAPTTDTDIVLIGAARPVLYTHRGHGGKLALALGLRSSRNTPRIHVETQLRGIF
jgi:hypothetical protein